MIANYIGGVSPKEFSPPPFRYFNHLRTPTIKESEMKHFKNFIKSTGSSWDLSKNKRRSSIKIASDWKPDSSIMRQVTEKGFFLDGQGNAYPQRGGKFGGKTDYNPDVHGLPVPLGKGKTRKGLKIAHHTGGKHFTEPSMDELIRGIIEGKIPRGTLGDEETENRMIEEYRKKLQSA